MRHYFGPLRLPIVNPHFPLRVVRCLVRRYITSEQRKSQNFNITEDDINEVRKAQMRAAVIAPRFRQHLPYWGPGFESQAHIYSFVDLYYCNCNEKRRIINKKRPRLAHKKKGPKCSTMVRPMIHQIACRLKPEGLMNKTFLGEPSGS